MVADIDATLGVQFCGEPAARSGGILDPKFFTDHLARPSKAGTAKDAEDAEAH